MTPRIFVGTMFSGEGDFAECIAAIAAQNDVIVTHKIIENLPEREAHNALWQSWRDVKHEHDLFVKVDADTVLFGPNTLKNVWDVMSADPNVTGMQAPLGDFFTDRLINGLNCFTPAVVFNDTTDDLFCDRQVDVGHNRVIKSDDVPVFLRPAGYHCHRATERQAFHFGLHRALKNQHHIIEQVREAHRRQPSRKRLFALEGAACAAAFKTGSFNYTDERFEEAFKAIKHKLEEQNV